MDKALELKRAEVELSRVRAAREEMELKIMERKSEIARLEENIEIQKAKESELSDKVNSLK